MSTQPMLASSDFVNVSVTVSPTAIPYSLFGIPMIAGDSAVIDTNERYRKYTGITGVAQDFGTTAAEYLAATVFFEQSPQPSTVYIGRWARTATSGALHGAVLTAAQQAALLTALQAITTGSLSISVNGTAHDITGLDFHSILNLNGAASVLQAALRTAFSGNAITVTWSPDAYDRFNVTSATTGATSSVSFAAAAASGVDVSTSLGLTSASGASPVVVGIAAETALAAATALANASSQWYGLEFAASTMPSASHSPPCPLLFCELSPSISASPIARSYI